MSFLLQVTGACITGIIFLLAVFVTGNLLGRFIRKFINSGIEWSNSISLFAGTLLFTSLYAIIQTAGNTILLGFILTIVLLVAGLIKFRDQKQAQAQAQAWDREDNRRDIYAVFGYYSFLSIVISAYFFFNYFGQDKIYQSHGDIIFDVDVVESLKNYGAENLHAQYNNFKGYASERQPYHYFEFWLSALLSKASGLNSFYILFITVPSLFFAISAFHIKKIAATIGISEKLSGYVPFLIFVKLVFIFPFLPNVIQSYIEIFLSPVVFILKEQVYLFFIYFALYLYFKKPALAMIPLLGLFFASISSVFSIGLLAGFIVLVLLLRKKYDTARFYMLASGSSFILILAFYFLNGFINGAGPKSDSYWHLSDMNIRTMINIIGGTGLKHIFLLLPYAVAFYLLVRVNKLKLKEVFDKNIGTLLLFAAVALAGGLIGWAIFYKTTNSVQFFSNVSSAVISSVLVMVTLFIIKKIASFSLKPLLALSFVPFLVLFYYSVNESCMFYGPQKPLSINFCTEINSEIAETGKEVGGYFMHDIQGEDILEAHKLVNWKGGALKLINPKFSVITLNIHKVKQNNWSDYDIPWANLYFKESPLYRNMSDSSIGGNFDYNRHMVDFIKANNIGFILVERDAEVPKSVTDIFNKRVYTDSISGLSYYSRFR